MLKIEDFSEKYVKKREILLILGEICVKYA